MPPSPFVTSGFSDSSPPVSQAGNLAQLARSAAGSSFIQAAMRDASDPRAVALVWDELGADIPDLVVDGILQLR